MRMVDDYHSMINFLYIATHCYQKAFSGCQGYGLNMVNAAEGATIFSPPKKYKIAHSL